MSNTRFEVWQIYTFTRVNFTHGSPRFGNLYIPWLDTLNSIESINLKCVEHHKVPDVHDPDGQRQYDGFIFLDNDNNRWANQYPRASYGQLSDAEDFHVRRDFEDDELLKYDNQGNLVKDENGQSIIKNKELWDIFDSQFCSPFVLSTTLLGQIYRHIHPTEAQQKITGLNDNNKAQLQEHLDKLVEQIEQTSGKKVCFENYVLKFTDGGPPKITNFKVARLV